MSIASVERVAPSVSAPVRPPRVLTAVPICDGHDSAVITVNRELVRAGVEVVYLGYNRAASVLARAAAQEDVAAVGISSYNGGHIEFFAEVREHLKRLRADRIRLFGGGGGTITPDDFAIMQAQGTDVVFMAGTGLDEINRYVVEHYRPAVPPPPDDEQQARCRAGDHEALGRLMSWIEAGADTVPFGAGQAARPTAGRQPDTENGGPPACRVVGITGPGGAGKSTLIDELLGRFLAARPQGRAAVLSTDPSSPASGGALLGDRAGLVYANTERVYYRSFAGRGRAGGLAACVPAATAALRGCGFDLILVETVGTGQDVDPFAVASRRRSGVGAAPAAAQGAGSFVDAAVYVMTPEYGSPLQLDKIAMLEIADAVVINKADRPAARTALAEVGRRVRRSGIPVYATVACRHRDAGMDRLLAEVVMTGRA